jgi:hypothetical protein
MPDIEAVGDAATGGILSVAVEPRHGGEGEGHTHERACLNCSTPLAGDYCHACGQKAHVHRTIAAWWHDLAHGVLHLDGKIWRTLPMLAWHPGALTRRYIEGERARFVSPLALFLFSVFLMFAVFSATGNKLIGDPTAVKVEVSDAIASSQEDLARIEQARTAAAAAKQSTAAIDRDLANARRELAALRKIQQEGLQAAGGDGLVNADFRDAPAGLRIFEDAYKKAKKNPSLLFYKVQTNAYKFSWALIPLSVPFLWLLFLHRRRYREQFSGYDHFVFVTYSIAAMSLALIGFVVVQINGIKSDLLNLAFVLIPPVHIYRQLRGAYQLSRWSASWRAFVLLWFSVIVLTLFGLILLAAGVLG